jgi:hypothetical protein
MKLTGYEITSAKPYYSFLLVTFPILININKISARSTALLTKLHEVFLIFFMVCKYRLNSFDSEQGSMAG